MKTKYTIKKVRNDWRILKNGKWIDSETSKDKAKGAVEFYKGYHPKRKVSKVNYLGNLQRALG